VEKNLTANLSFSQQIAHIIEKIRNFACRYQGDKRTEAPVKNNE
jgi:hypothetical protein